MTAEGEDGVSAEEELCAGATERTTTGDVCFRLPRRAWLYRYRKVFIDPTTGGVASVRITSDDGPKWDPRDVDRRQDASSRRSHGSTSSTRTTGIVLSGSQHNVEIFHPQNPNDVRHDATGTQQFQVSTGGIGLRSFTNTPANLIARDSSTWGWSATWGWLKLTLRPNGAYSLGVRSHHGHVQAR